MEEGRRGREVGGGMEGGREVGGGMEGGREGGQGGRPADHVPRPTSGYQV